MHFSAAMPIVAGSAAIEQDCHHMDAAPLRTASGFVLGTMLSGAMWTVAGMLAWYFI